MTEAERIAKMKEMIAHLRNQVKLGLPRKLIAQILSDIYLEKFE